VTSVFANTGVAYYADRPRKETTLGIIVATPVAAP